MEVQNYEKDSSRSCGRASEQAMGSGPWEGEATVTAALSAFPSKILIECFVQ